MRESRWFGFLFGAGLILNYTALVWAQGAAADATAKGSATTESSAAVEKAGTKPVSEAAAKSTTAASGMAEDSAEVKRGLASLKSGTTISAELDNTIDGRTAKPGEIVSARVTKNVKQKGHTVIRKGDRLLGRVISAEAGSSGHAGSELGVTFDRLKRGDAEYQLNTFVSSVVSTSSNMAAGNEMSPLDEPIMMPGPAPVESGGRAAGGGSLLGGVTSTVGSTVSAAGSAVGGVASSAGGTTSSTLGSAGTAVGASEHGSAQSGSGLGVSTPLRDIRLNSQTSASQNGQSTSVLGARHGNLRLESGSRMRFRISDQTDVESSKK